MAASGLAADRPQTAVLPAVLPAVLAGTLTIVLATGCGRANAAVPVAAPVAGPASEPGCARLHAVLPRTLEPGVEARATTPVTDRTAAWGSPPVTLRCGVGRPQGFRAGAGTAQVNGVQWFQRVGAHAVRWTAVDRAVYLELAIPASYSSQAAFLVDLAAPVTAALPAVPVDPSR